MEVNLSPAVRPVCMCLCVQSSPSQPHNCSVGMDKKSGTHLKDGGERERRESKRLFIFLSVFVGTAELSWRRGEDLFSLHFLSSRVAAWRG